jgi:DNA-binding NarL/FixJ family response regulator
VILLGAEMKHKLNHGEKMKQTRINVEHRRSLLMELVAKGYTNQRQLASRLHVSPATIHRDFEVIAKRATENLDGWIDFL